MSERNHCCLQHLAQCRYIISSTLENSSLSRKAKRTSILHPAIHPTTQFVSCEISSYLSLSVSLNFLVGSTVVPEFHAVLSPHSSRLIEIELHFDSVTLAFQFLLLSGSLDCLETLTCTAPGLPPGHRSSWTYHPPALQLFKNPHSACALKSLHVSVDFPNISTLDTHKLSKFQLRACSTSWADAMKIVKQN